MVTQLHLPLTEEAQEGAHERQAHIQRLQRSLERWRTGGLDHLLPEEYGHWCGVLAHLEAGGEYTVRRFDPSEALARGDASYLKEEARRRPFSTEALVLGVAQGIAGWVSEHQTGGKR